MNFQLEATDANISCIQYFYHISLYCMFSLVLFVIKLSN